MTTAPPPAHYGAVEGALASGFATAELHHLWGHDLQIAAQRLRGSHEPIACIAFEIGYESEAAFNRAFRRTFEMPPTAWRKMQSGGS
ncbi:helix-turn-helix domain-containing protein [Sinorhizobium meliloti]|uniref:Helix-turn-helix domain-containing protein n=1 Tax=Rhizobium meliloti TaxID=382 RepID=A0A6A7ZYN7_RHIML|nr:AraC family transcriptional regulator [Sinorhizobium meliloti]MQW07790.1 helix-turn-helix domain-containing protein [Sinorhizobium meliloti]